MTDYTEAPNGPVCGFCGYEVEDCEAQNWSECGDQYSTLNPCPGIEARAFLAPTPPEPTGACPTCGDVNCDSLLPWDPPPCPKATPPEPPREGESR
jgi:hypothetical protein